MVGQTHPGSRFSGIALIAAGVASLPTAGRALVPEASLGEIIGFGAGTVATPENALALVAAGLFLGAGRGAGAAGSVSVGVAAAAAGAAAGLVVGAPLYLDVLIAGAGGAITVLMALGLRSARVSSFGLAVVAALFGLGIGATLRLGGASAIHLATYALVVVVGAAAVVAVGAALGRTLRLRRERMIRGLGAWVSAVAVLVIASGSLQRGTNPGPSAVDLRVGSGKLAEGEIPDLVRALLEQVYFAFEKQDEEEIYDALAAVAADEVLTELYLQKRAALALQEDGRRSDIDSVELERTAADPRSGTDGYHVHGVWSVRGSVIHWGHVHDRVNRYEADLDIVPVDGFWKIGAFDLIDVVREDPPR